MSSSSVVFFRLLADEDKGGALREAVAAIAGGEAHRAVHAADPESFHQVPGSPFAYWVSEALRRLFVDLPKLESGGRDAQSGASTMDDFRFVRAWWEVEPNSSARDRVTTLQGGRWVPFAKGGVFSTYYYDCELVVDWANDGETLKREVAEYRGSRGWGYQWSAALNGHSFYFRPGLSWPRRTQGGLNVRALPAGCIIGDKGPAIFVPADATEELWRLLALMNSHAFRALVDLQMAFGSFEVGVIVRTPVPDLVHGSATQLRELASTCLDYKRVLDTVNETSHVFTVPALLQMVEQSLVGRLCKWGDRLTAVKSEIARKEAQIDEIAFGLYGVAERDCSGTGTVLDSLDSGSAQQQSAIVRATTEEDSYEDDPTGAGQARRGCVADLLSYAAGLAFGRWDARLGVNPSLAPKLADPFAPLPICPPGMLVVPDGLPAQKDSIASEEWLRARPDAITLPPEGAVAHPTITGAEYPLSIAWDGIVVDDADHPDDMVGRVRQVLELLWGQQAEAIEQEACQILGVGDLREYFRNPRHFFEEHVKRYSKSRRQAPTYWLLQSGRRSYGLWLYYHRLDKDLLFKALVSYVEPKIRREENRRQELEAQRGGTAGAGARELERALERQDSLLSELRDFHDKLKRTADLELEPDLDDGVVLNIAPLRELVPWKVAKEYWDELLVGRYAWSNIGQQLRAKGLVR